MKDKFLALLSLSSAERKGVIVLIAVIFVITGIQAWIAFTPPHEKPLVDSLLLKEIALFEEGIVREDTATITSASYGGDDSDKPGLPETAELFVFDPNTINASEMKRLGLESKLIRTIINYRNHGGRFFKPADLKKIYGINSLVYDRIAPYISIPRAGIPIVHEKKISMTGINTADSVQLVKVPGVGPVLARRILRYRELIGGYYELGQLKEVYGLQDSVITKIKESFFADTANIIRLNLNTALEQELARHPYIGRYASKGIVKYRSSVSKIIKVEELVANGILTEDQ